MQQFERDVIIACDFSDAQTTLQFLGKFGETKPFAKIGMQLYYSEGPDIVRKIKDLGHPVFLDLKLCDTPTTVKNAMKVLKYLKVDMTNVHALGGIEMMEAAIAGLTDEDGNRSTKLLAVTILTSIAEETMQRELLIQKPIREVVPYLAHLAETARLNGVVCSPHEANVVHTVCGNDFLTVTPGIRLEGDSAGCQKRFTTPLQAKQAGSNYIVVGSSITQAKDPVAAYYQCVEQFCN